MNLWGDDSPPGAANSLQAAISRLRRVLPQGRLITEAAGYLLRIFPGELDVSQFEQLVSEGREALTAGDAEQAARTLRQALSLWQGPALADFRYEPFAQAEIVRLEELHLTCLEERIEADLALGLANVLVAELRRLVSEHPMRERLRGQLMLALYRDGRQTEALEVYREFRSVLRESWVWSRRRSCVSSRPPSCARTRWPRRCRPRRENPWRAGPSPSSAFCCGWPPTRAYHWIRRRTKSSASRRFMA
jgi:DNA-binding transcriptional activator of the SARP family